MKAVLLALAALALPACEEDINDDSTPPAVTRRVSVTATGVEADRDCQGPDLTSDGRYAVFETAAALVTADTNGKIDIYRKDLQTGAILLVSVNDLGEPGDGDSTAPSISADGTRVAFESRALNLAATAVAGASEIYVRDLDAGTTTHISQAEGGGPATVTDGSAVPMISGDGLYVVFASDGEDIVSTPPTTNPTTNIFRTELASGIAEMVSVTPLGDAGEEPSTRPSTSFDGSIVAFESAEDDLVAGDANAAFDIFVRDMSLGETERVGGDGPSTAARVTPNGRFLVFRSEASDLVPGDGNGLPDVFLRDRQSPATTKVSVSFLGAGAAGESSDPAVSADGRFVAFLSRAPNLVPGDGNDVADHFVWDAATGVTHRVSVRTGGAQTSQPSRGRPAITGDGRFVLFASSGPDLVVGDSNGVDDIFLRGPNY